MSIYFDYAATTPVRPEAARAAYECLTEGFGNPSSGYALGKQAADRLKADRAAVADALGCAPGEVFFTSCGTEGDNWALQAALHAGRRRGRHLITSVVEHAAVTETARALEREGYSVTWLRPDGAGRISPEAVAAAVTEQTAAVSLMLVNNETGAVTDIAACVAAVKAHSRDIIFHTDAVQAFFKVPFTPKQLGVDRLTVSGHKIGDPKGIGALYIKKELLTKIIPLLHGGAQEEGLRPGTEPTAQIAAFAAACRAAAAEGSAALEACRAAKEHCLEQLRAQVPGLEVVCPGDAPHICAVSLPGYPSQMVVNALDEKGFCLSHGSACHKGKPSHVYAALGLPPRVLMGMLRISFSPLSTPGEGDALAQALAQVAAERLPMP